MLVLKNACFNKKRVWCLLFYMILSYKLNVFTPRSAKSTVMVSTYSKSSFLYTLSAGTLFSIMLRRTLLMEFSFAKSNT